MSRMAESTDIMSVFRTWQIICYLCGRFGHDNPWFMLISIIIGLIIAFVLGKKTVKNIKENGRRKENGDSSGGAEEGKED